MTPVHSCPWSILSAHLHLADDDRSVPSSVVAVSVQPVHLRFHFSSRCRGQSTISEDTKDGHAVFYTDGTVVEVGSVPEWSTQTNRSSFTMEAMPVKKTLSRLTTYL